MIRYQYCLKCDRSQSYQKGDKCEKCGEDCYVVNYRYKTTFNLISLFCAIMSVLSFVFGMLITLATGYYFVCFPGFVGIIFWLMVAFLFSHLSDINMKDQMRDEARSQQMMKEEKKYSNDRFCIKCGRSIPFDAVICPYCKYDYDEDNKEIPPPPED